MICRNGRWLCGGGDVQWRPRVDAAGPPQPRHVPDLQAPGDAGQGPGRDQAHEDRGEQRLGPGRRQLLLSEEQARAGLRDTSGD